MFYKLQDKDLKIILPKTTKDLKKSQPVWVHRAFQNMPKINGIEHVDLINPKKDFSKAKIVSEKDIEHPNIVVESLKETTV